jgi:hypothetical protein
VAQNAGASDDGDRKRIAEALQMVASTQEFQRS